jgi:hypothetical protein
VSVRLIHLFFRFGLRFMGVWFTGNMLLFCAMGILSRLYKIA